MSDHDDFKAIDLNKPEDAREFLENLAWEGKRVTRFTTSKGRKLTVKEMTDKEAVRFARQMHKELFEGEDYVDMNSSPKRH